MEFYFFYPLTLQLSESVINFIYKLRHIICTNKMYLLEVYVQKVTEAKTFQRAVFYFGISCNDLFYPLRRQWNKTCPSLLWSALSWCEVTQVCVGYAAERVLTQSANTVEKFLIVYFEHLRLLYLEHEQVFSSFDL